MAPLPDLAFLVPVRDTSKNNFSAVEHSNDYTITHEHIEGEVKSIMPSVCCAKNCPRMSIEDDSGRNGSAICLIHPSVSLRNQTHWQGGNTHRPRQISSQEEIMGLRSQHFSAPGLDPFLKLPLKLSKRDQDLMQFCESFTNFVHQR